MLSFVQFSKNTHVFFLLSFLFVLPALCDKAMAQNTSQYTFSTSGTASLTTDINGNTISMASGTTQLVGAGQDDASSTVNSIGFSFTFTGTTYTQFSASSNGAIRLGATAMAAASYGNAFPVASQSIISPYWGDLETNATTGKVHFKVVGSYPNRTLVVEFLNMRINYGSTTANGTYQARLYEQTNVIEFVYGAMSVGSNSTTGSTAADARTAIIGFSNSTGANNQFSVSQASPYTTSTTATRITNTNATTGVITGLNSSADGSRRSFTFTPTLAYKSQFISMSTGSASWCAGEIRNVTVTIKNIGTSAWTTSAPVMNIGAKFNANADYDYRVSAGGLAPGATATYTIAVTAPSSASATEALTFDVVKEGLCWFGGNAAGCAGPGNIVYVSTTQTINAKPSITVGTNPSVCQGITSANLSYSAATGSPNQYSIDYDATANAAGFTDVTNTALPATPIVLTVPAGAVASTYNATLTVRNSSTGCVGNNIPITVTVNALPTISLGSVADICRGTTTASLTYSGTTGSPSQYSIDYNSAANTAGFADVTNIALPASPISLTVPGGAAPGTYNATLTVRNTTTGCVSSSNAFTITLLAPTVNITGSSTICEGSTTTLSPATGGTWISNNPSVASVDNDGIVTGISGGTVTFTFTETATGCSNTTSAVTVNANSGIALSSAAGTDAQTICINTAITNITYQLSGGATGASVSAGALPAGITGSYNSTTKVFTISGTATVDGNFNYTITTTGPCINNSLNGTINITPASAISLTSAAGTNTQTVCIDNAITDIVYTVSGNATGASLTAGALPAGVNGSFNGVDQFIITGTPTVSGTFNYTISSTGPCPVSLNGTITVNANSTLTLTSAAGTDAQTKCINTAITNIAYTIGGGGNGASITAGSLPTGVTGSYNAGTKVFTISGTPATTGIFNYTVTTSGPCINQSLSGSIEVLGNATLSLTSGTGSNIQTVCENSPISDVTYSIGGTGTSAAATGLPAGITGAYNNGTFTISGTPTVSGIFNFTVTTSGPCVNPSLTGTINVNALPTGVSIAPASAAICNGNSIALTASGSTGSTGVLINDNFNGTPTFTGSGTTTGSRSQVFTKETSGTNINSVGTFTSPNGGSFMAALAAAPGTFGTATSSANTNMVSGIINTTGYSSLNLSYNHTYKQGNVSGSGTVEISVNGGAFTVIKTFTTNQGAATSFVADNISLSGTYLNQTNIRIRFNFVSSNSSGFLQANSSWWVVDDVLLNGQLVPLFSWSADTDGSVNGLPAGASTPSLANQNITVNPATTTTYTLTVQNPVTNCGISTATSTVTVHARPTAVLSGGAVYCNGQSTTTGLSLAVTGSGTISGTLSDGTVFSGTAPTITVNVSPASTINYTIATLSDENCTAIAADLSGTATVTVNARPTAVLSGSTSYCEGQSTTTTLSLAVTGSGTISGTLSDGTPFSGTTPSITVDVTPAVTTSYTIATLSDANCSAIAADLPGTATITINPNLPVSVSIVSSDADNTICDGTSITFTATPVNGGNTSYQWLLNGNNVGSNQDTYTTSSLVNGDEVSVVLTSDIAPCATGNPATSNSIITTVNANQPVSVTIISSDNDNTICEGSSVTFTATPVNGGANPSYQWLLNGNNVGSDQDTYITSSLIDGDVVTVVLTSDITPCATGNPATSNSNAITVNANQPVSVNISATASAICQGTAVTFTATPVNGGTNPAYQWYIGSNPVSGETSSTYTSSLLNDGDGISVVLTSDITPCATGNPATSNTITISVNPVPATPGAISGITNACELINTGVSTTYSIAAVPGAVGYTWVLPPGIDLVSGQGTTSIEVTFNSNLELTHNFLRVTAQTAFPCSSLPSTLEIFKIIPGIPIAINGPTNVCPFVGQPINAVYTIDPVANATSYTWTAANGAIIVSGQGTTSIEVSYPAGFTSGNIKVTANANCGSRSPRSLNVVKLVPSAPAPISGPVNACPFIGTTIEATYSVPTVVNATSYLWTVPANVNIVSGQGTNSINVTFNNGYTTALFKVRAVADCASSNDRTLSVTSSTYGAPGAIAGPTNACPFIGTAVQATYSIRKVLNAPAYIWTVPTGVTVSSHPGGAGVNDTIINVTFDNNFVSGTSITVQTTGCTTSAASSISITRVASTTSTPGLITGPKNVCEFMISGINPAGIPATYTIRKVNGALSYIWTAPVNAVITGHPGGAGVNDTIVEITYDNNFTTGTLSVVSSNGCGTSSARTLAITKLKPSAPGAVDIIQTGTCPSRTFTYTLGASPSNTTSILWTVPADATLVSGQGTLSITVSYPPTVINGTVTATSVNNCATGNTRTISVKLPACPPPGFGKLNATMEESIPVTNMSVIVSPNPTVSDFRLQVITTDKQPVNVRILDMQGREMKKLSVAPYQTIQVGGELKAGYYFIETRQGNVVKTTKLMKF